MTVQTIDPIKQVTAPVKPPPLRSGDRLSQAEFERRYEASPHIRAELIEGVVYMASPIRYRHHSYPHIHMGGWLVAYEASTPGTEAGGNSTTRLDLENEPEPDALLRLEPACGGQSTVSADDYLEGAPELIVEVAASSTSYDLRTKRRVYARNGVREYIVVQMVERRVDWFALREGIYEPLAPDEAGILRSEIFPGLWLRPAAIWAGDAAALLATLQEGLSSPEHATFVATLQARREQAER
jgi:Uma2 family endonuclease